MNHNDYTYFVLNKNGNAAYSFTGYTDKETGVTVAIYKGRKDKKTGEDVPHRFGFDRAHRSIRVHNKDASLIADSKGVKMKSADFIRNFPECKGSPNGHYDDNGVQSGIMFSEVKAREDAMTAVEAKTFKIKAESAALNLTGGELREMAILVQCFDTDELMQKHKVLEYAGSDPADFMALYNSPERSANALLKKSIQAGIVSVKGTLYIWGNDTIGATHELAVSKLMVDKDVATALKEAIRKSKN